MSVSMTPEAIEARLREASRLADLRPERRLHAKLDMSSAGIRRRLDLVDELNALCRALGDAKPITHDSTSSRDGDD